MRKPVFIAVTIFFLNVLIATSCFAKEKPKERKQFCEGVGPVYSINEDVTPPLLNVGSYRPVLKNNKAMLVLINDELQKAIGILVRTTKQKKTDDNNKKGQSNKTIETFFLDFRFYLIRLIEDESDKAMMSFGEKAYRVQISFGGKKWHDVKNFSGRFQIFSNDASFILTLWDSAIQDAADFFRGCLNKFPTYTYKSQWGDFDGDLGCGYIIVEDMICPPWYIRCNDCDPFYNSWLDWLEDQEDTAPSSGFDWDDFPNNGGSVSEWDDCGPGGPSDPEECKDPGSQKFQGRGQTSSAACADAKKKARDTCKNGFLCRPTVCAFCYDKWLGEYKAVVRAQCAPGTSYSPADR